ncbi:YceI family protein [Subsaxibacter sp. CAU 1640]|uniref:YceI family protein n=1 Tax=Subsaxibacter sp. CAU 1640 TaxID=2933271 RepID=UPI0020040329|nr:YceI family protein [Subsaxibacter sp. CAU 1640]MCK7590554.1 YceI family protein [Subsaxibacter sp. CAU 1640]
MRRTVILFVLVSTYIFSSCKNEDKKEVSENLLSNESNAVEVMTVNPLINGKLVINTQKSSIFWRGTMLFSFGEHYGNVNFKDGFVELDNDKIVGGSFTVDMNTIVNTDGDYSQDLVDHLKNEDFFEVNKYPEATLEFKKFERVDKNRQKIDADLTIKGITKRIELFNVDFDPGQNKISTKFKFDRTDFGITYSSKGVAQVKDYAISDAIELEVEVYLN